MSAPNPTRRLVLTRLGQAGAVLGASGALAALGVLSHGRSAGAGTAGRSEITASPTSPDARRSSWRAARIPPRW